MKECHYLYNENYKMRIKYIIKVKSEEDDVGCCQINSTGNRAGNTEFIN